VIAEAAKNMSVLSTQLVRESMDDPGPRGKQTRLMVAEQIRSTKSAEYFSLDLVLGHQYRDSSIIAADPADRPPDDDQWATTVRPGRRIPHAWLRLGVSSLDLAGPGFSVVAPETADTGSLVQAAAARRVPLTVHLDAPPIKQPSGEPASSSCALTTSSRGAARPFLWTRTPCSIRSRAGLPLV
jgi:hypothetical protein